MPHPMRSSSMLILALVPLGACGSEGANVGSGNAVTPLDSAGIPVVVNAGDVGSTPVWRVVPEPLFVLGMTEGPPEYLFHDVQGVALLSNGGLAAVNGGTHEMRVYDSEGQHQGSGGRQGEGPGEFRRIELLGAFEGDSVAVLDAPARRVSVFGPGGGYVRSFPVPASLAGMVRAGGVLSDGTVMVWRQGSPHRHTGVAHVPIDVDLVSPGGEATAQIGGLPGPELSVFIPDGGGFSGVLVIHGRTTHVAAGADRVVVASEDAYGVQVYNGSGRLARVIRQDREPEAVDPAFFDEFSAQMIANARGPEARQNLEMAIAQMPRYSTGAALGSLRVDRHGHLLVEEYEAPRVERLWWQVFDPEGTLIARIEFPPGFRLMDIDVGRGRVAGLTEDEFGVQRVVVAEVQR